MIYYVRTQQTQPSASYYSYMFRSLPRPTSDQHLSVKVTTRYSAQYTFCNPTCLQNVRKTIIKVI
jgi:hypothetical protein